MGNTFKFILEYRDYISNIEKTDKDDYIYNEILKRTKFGKLSISEGLIFTHPVDKSTNVLKRRFSELKVEIEEDGEIYIEIEKPSKIGKYLPIITNLGYFISLYTLDGSNWLKYYNNDTEMIALYLEPKYDLKVDIPNILYHVSPVRFKDKISKIGFIPKTGNKISKHPERIYLTDDLKTAINFGDNIKSETNSEYCIYKISGDCIENLYSDINLRNGGFYTLQNIPPDKFELIKEIE
jgi:hypothetical protein